MVHMTPVYTHEKAAGCPGSHPVHVRRAATGILRAASKFSLSKTCPNPVQAIHVWTEKRVLDAFWTRDLKRGLDAEKYGAHTGMLH